jgi:hypothetical protein
MIIATPDEILQKGLELGGFGGRRQQKVKRPEARPEKTRLRHRTTQIHCLLQKES